MRGPLIWIICILGCGLKRAPEDFTLRVAVSGALETVTPDTELRSWASIAQPWVFEPLARLTARGEIEPVLAARVEVLGPQTLRLWVRTDARFADGSQITFQDVANSVAWNRLKATRAPGEAILIESIEPGTPPELLLARTPVFRRSLGRIFGAGPFEIVEQDVEHIVVERRERKRGLIARVLIHSYATPRDAVFHTLKGDADLLPEVEPRWLEFFDGVKRLKAVHSPGTHANIVAFNLSRLSRQERKVLAQILASDQLRLQAFGEDCAPPEHRSENKPSIAGPQLDVTAVTFFDRFALAVQRTLGARGGAVRLIDVAAYFEAMKRRDFDLIAARPLISPPSMAALIWRTGAAINVLGYTNAAVDAALDAHDWEGARRALDDDPPAAFVCTLPYIMMVDSRIRNATSTPIDLPQWEVAR